MKVYGSIVTKQPPEHPSPRGEGQSGEEANLLSNDASLTRPDSDLKVSAGKLGGFKRLGSSGFAAVALCALFATLGLSNSAKDSVRSFFQKDEMLMHEMPVDEMLELEPNAFTLAEADFQLLAFGEGGGICAGDKSVSQEQCYEAAKAVGTPKGFAFANDQLNVGTWNFLPCGCFMYDAGAEKWIDYKDPSAGNCVAPQKAALVCKADEPAPAAPTADESELYEFGEGNGKCDGNKGISQDDCLEVATNLGKSAGMTKLKDFLNVGKWSFTPCGCFIYIAGGEQWIDYKDPSVGNCKADPAARLVCLKEEPMPVDVGEESSDFELLGKGEGGGICPEGQATSKEECLDASHDVGGAAGMTKLKNFLNVGTWPFTPCGCFIYADEWVDFKDPALGNCKPDPRAQLVCSKKKEPSSLCAPPKDHPCGSDDCKHTCVIRPGKCCNRI